VQVQAGRYEALQRAHFQLDLPIAVEEQMVQSQTAERVVLYNLRARTPDRFDVIRSCTTPGLREFRLLGL